MDKNKFIYYASRADLSLKSMARQMGINVSTLWRKLNGRSDFTRSEIETYKKITHTTNEELLEVFFSQNIT